MMFQISFEEEMQKKCLQTKMKMEAAMIAENTASTLEKCFKEMKKYCEDLKSTTLVDYVKFSFESRKTADFKSECPKWKDFEKLLIINKNLKVVDKNYEEAKPLEQEVCEFFEPKFTQPFGAVEADPSMPNAIKLMKDASDAFPFAQKYCKTIQPHPAYDHSALNIYLIERIKTLSKPFDAQMYKYIKVLQLLNPESLYLIKLLSITELVERSPELLERMAKEAEKVSGQASLPQQEKYAALVNSSLFSLVGLVKANYGSDENALMWMRSGFDLLENKEFPKFLKAKYLSGDRILLEKVLKEASKMHTNNAFYLECLQQFNESEKQVSSSVIYKALAEQVDLSKIPGHYLVACHGFSTSVVKIRHDLKGELKPNNEAEMAQEMVPFMEFFIREIKQQGRETWGNENEEKHRFYLNSINRMGFNEVGWFHY